MRERDKPAYPVTALRTDLNGVTKFQQTVIGLANAYYSDPAVIWSADDGGTATLITDAATAIWDALEAGQE